MLSGALRSSSFMQLGPVHEAERARDGIGMDVCAEFCREKLKGTKQLPKDYPCVWKNICAELLDIGMKRK